MVGVEANKLKELHHPLATGLPGNYIGMDDQWFADERLDRHPGIQGGRGVLEDHLDMTTRLAHTSPAQVVGALAEDLDLTRRGAFEPGEQPGERGLSRSRLSDETKRLPSPDLEIDAIDRVQPRALDAPRHPNGDVPGQIRGFENHLIAYHSGATLSR